MKHGSHILTYNCVSCLVGRACTPVLASRPGLLFSSGTLCGVWVGFSRIFSSLAPENHPVWSAALACGVRRRPQPQVYQQHRVCFQVTLAPPPWVLLRGGSSLLMGVRECPSTSWYLATFLLFSPCGVELTPVSPWSCCSVGHLRAQTQVS